MLIPDYLFGNLHKFFVSIKNHHHGIGEQCANRYGYSKFYRPVRAEQRKAEYDVSRCVQLNAFD